MKITEGLTFDDVLLVPQRSAVVSRKDVDLKTKISRSITLNFPVISHPMDKVTESKMAITMAKNGAMGIIHRFTSVEREVSEVLKVKRAENYTVDEPFTIDPEATLDSVHRLMHEHEIQSFVVVNKERKLMGILTKRDIKFETDPKKKVKDLMTPRQKLITGSPDTTPEQAEKFFHTEKIEKLPLVDKKDRLVGLITARDLEHRLNPLAVRDKKGRLVVGAAIGIRGDYLERAQALVVAGVDLLCVDVAHGHLEISLKAVENLRKKFPGIDLMAGNVATAEGVKDLVSAGADSIRVGIGNGTICKTREVTGVGVPQITAILDSKTGVKDIPLIADGGMRGPADLMKALSAGASAGTFGSLFAGTDEAPGEIVMWNGRRSKLYRGSASLSINVDTKGLEGNGNVEEILSDFVSEGADQVAVPYRGSAVEVLAQIIGGLRSGFSYCGAHNLKELWEKAQLIRVTESGRREGSIHDVEY
jgi:IMP dehydrogenase